MRDKIIKETYTFDDLLLVPRYSQVLPNETILKTKLTPKITLNIPVISAAMDTVTEDKMAICLSRLGGLGIIHKNMSIEKQAFLVSKVKRIESGMITNPFTVKKEDTLHKVVEYLENFGISGLPVVNDQQELVGIITHRDMKYQTNLHLLVEDVMTKDPLITARAGITLNQAKDILIKNKIEKLPILNEKNHLVGMITLKDIENVNVYPNACKDPEGRLIVGAAVGVGKDTLDRVEALVQAGVDIISIDSAHGHSEGVLKTIREIRKNYPLLEIIGGNVCTREGAEALIEAGVNSVKVGVGPGSICTTRVVSGVGVPQLSAINDAYEACKGKVSVIADGGIKLSGDITKALASGGDAVMLGGLLAGCDEAPGEEIIFNGRKFKVYVGMGSIAAMQRGSSDRYFQGNQKEMKKLVPEGIEARVPYKGTVSDVIFQLMGGLRSGMGYCGCETIEKLKLEAKFVKITNAGLSESHPHDVTLLKEAPNYTTKD